MKKIILAAMAFAAVVSAKAQDINAVLKSVEQNNMELKALLKGNEAADIENKSQNTLEDLSIEYSPFFQSETSGIASSELVITQGFDFPTLYGARKKAGQLQRNVLDMQYQTARRDILVNAKKLCLDIINYNKQKQLLQERRKNADELLAMFELKFKNGDATSLELNKIKLDRMNLETELVQADTKHANAMQQLQALNGGLPIEVNMTEYPQAPADDEVTMYEKAVATDWTVRTAQASVLAAEQDVKVNKQSWIPKFEIGYRRNTEGDNASNGFLIGGSIPLFSSKNKVKIAKARQTEAVMQHANARINAENSARTMINQMKQLKASADAYDVPLMRQTLKLLRTAVENGEISVTEYYVEADNIYKNMITYMDIERQYQDALTEIYKNEL
ncbi:TolC family protein [uncultured Prevotella sp.]|jgi:outer membrane protein TolC|uniref:TolC family protein n=1 Tax=uncultured Prevotella sp. TaxID=159272 RepID=UPI0026747D07|nr:TolC family protein [uncultured Prevotella sp.]